MNAVSETELIEIFAAVVKLLSMATNIKLLNSVN